MNRSLIPAVASQYLMRHVTVKASGVSLHVAEAGAGDPILLLHGFPDHWRVWEPILPTLASVYRVWAPDLRGVNVSEKPSEVSDYEVSALVEDVCELLRCLGSRVTLIGHDWGGMLAWITAARFPDLVSKLVIINAPHPCRFAELLRVDPMQRSVSSYVARLAEHGAEERLAADNYQRLWEVVAGSERNGLETHRSECVEAWAQPGALTAALNWYRALDFDRALTSPNVASVPDIGSASGQIDVPTYVLWGELDGSFSNKCLEGLEQWVPDLSVTRLADSGHWPMRDTPNLLGTLILGYLAGRETPACA